MRKRATGCLHTGCLHTEVRTRMLVHRMLCGQKVQQLRTLSGLEHVNEAACKALKDALQTTLFRRRAWPHSVHNLVQTQTARLQNWPIPGSDCTLCVLWPSCPRLAEVQQRLLPHLV